MLCLTSTLLEISTSLRLTFEQVIYAVKLPCGTKGDTRLGQDRNKWCQPTKLTFMYLRPKCRSGSPHELFIPQISPACS